MIKKINKKCRLCGNTNPHRLRPDNKPGTICWCMKCESQKQTDRDNKEKSEFVNFLGNKCSKCVIVDHNCIYDFHHNDPLKKDNVLSKIPKIKKTRRIKKMFTIMWILSQKTQRRQD